MKNKDWKEDFYSRLKTLGITIIILSDRLPKTPAGFAIASQIIRSGTSIGANFIEAQNASSKKDFVHKLSIALRESTETVYWLEIMNESKLLGTYNLQKELEEARAITAILISSVKNSKINLHSQK